MKFKKILIAGLVTCSMAAGSFALGASAFACGGKHGHKHGRWSQMTDEQRLEAMDKHLDKRMARLDKKLNLSAAQHKQVRQIFESTRTQMMDIRQRHKGDRQGARKEARQVFQQSKAKIKKVLTPEQQQKFKQLRQKRRQHHARRRMHHMFRRLDKALDLNAQQEKQVKQIIKETHQQVRQAFKDNTDRKARRQAIRAAFKNGGDKIEAVLNADQKAKFQKMRERMKKRFGHRHHRRGPGEQM